MDDFMSRMKKEEEERRERRIKEMYENAEIAYKRIDEVADSPQKVKEEFETIENLIHGYSSELEYFTKYNLNHEFKLNKDINWRNIVYQIVLSTKNGEKDEGRVVFPDGQNDSDISVGIEKQIGYTMIPKESTEQVIRFGYQEERNRDLEGYETNVYGVKIKLDSDAIYTLYCGQHRFNNFIHKYIDVFGRDKTKPSINNRLLDNEFKSPFFKEFLRNLEVNHPQAYKDLVDYNRLVAEEFVMDKICEYHLDISGTPQYFARDIEERKEAAGHWPNKLNVDLDSFPYDKDEFLASYKEKMEKKYDIQKKYAGTCNYGLQPSPRIAVRDRIESMKKRLYRY